MHQEYNQSRARAVKIRGKISLTKHCFSGTNGANVSEGDLCRILVTNVDDFVHCGNFLVSFGSARQKKKLSDILDWM